MSARAGWPAGPTTPRFPSSAQIAGSNPRLSSSVGVSCSPACTAAWATLRHALPCRNAMRAPNPRQYCAAAAPGASCLPLFSSHGSTLLRESSWGRRPLPAPQPRTLPCTQARARAAPCPVLPPPPPPTLPEPALEPPPPETYDNLMNAFHTFVDPLVSRVLSALGGPDSWQTYLLSRFFAEVVLVVVLVLGAYHLLTVVATRGSQFLEEPLPSAPRSRQPKAPAAAAPPSAVATAAPALASTGGLGLPAGSVVGATTGSGSGGSSKGSLMRLVPAALTGAPARLLVLLVLAGSLMRLVHAALTGAPARLFVLLVLAVNVTRNSAFIIDGFIATFNPRLPVAWLDDLVRLVGKSLTPLDSFLTKLSLAGTTLFACAVLLKWKDASVAWFVKQHVETLDQGQEIITGFLNPASNLVNLLVIVGTALWLAMHLGLNLQPLLAVGGASGIIIGLGTQQILSNFVSGLNIFLARPFVAGEYISILGPNLLATQVSGKVIRVDPMRTLLATQDHWCIAVPNKMIADCVVINRTRTPHWSVGSASPLLSNMRELRFRLKLPHESLSRLKELSTALDAALEEAMPRKTVRRSEVVMELVEFTEKGAEVIVKCNLAWRLRKDPSEMPSREQHAQQEAKETLMQAALLALHGVVRRYDGLLVSGYF